MGADLYMIEPSCDEHTKKMGPLFDAAVRHRDSLMAAAKFEGREIKYEDGMPVERELRAACIAVDEAFDKMYPDELYFRDAYNGSSVAARLGFSWWADVIPMLNEDGDLSPEGCEKLLSKIEWREVGPDKKQNKETAFTAGVAGAIASTLPAGAIAGADIEEQEYFTQKRERLIAFLRAGAKGKGIHCSL